MSESQENDWIEKERRTREQRAASEARRSPTAITYRGFCYDVRSQFGVDSLKAAIKSNGDD